MERGYQCTKRLQGLAVLLRIPHHVPAALHAVSISGKLIECPAKTFGFSIHLPLQVATGIANKGHPTDKTSLQPTIIRDLGYTAAKAQLLTVPPYALATIFTVLWAVLSERAQKRAPFIITTSSLAAIGYIILITNTHPSKRPGVSYVGTFFAAAGIYPSTALSLTLPAVNVGGQTKRATATALQISIGNLGAVLGTQLYRAETSPRYVLGHSFALGYLLCNVIVLSITWWALSRENRVKDRALQQLAADGPVDSGVLAAEGHKADHTAQESKVGALAVNGDAALTYKFTI